MEMDNRNREVDSREGSAWPVILSRRESIDERQKPGCRIVIAGGDDGGVDDKRDEWHRVKSCKVAQQ